MSPRYRLWLHTNMFFIMRVMRCPARFSLSWKSTELWADLRVQQMVSRRALFPLHSTLNCTLYHRSHVYCLFLLYVLVFHNNTIMRISCMASTPTDTSPASWQMTGDEEELENDVQTSAEGSNNIERLSSMSWNSVMVLVMSEQVHHYHLQVFQDLTGSVGWFFKPPQQKVIAKCHYAWVSY